MNNNYSLIEHGLMKSLVNTTSQTEDFVSHNKFDLRKKLTKKDQSIVIYPC